MFSRFSSALSIAFSVLLLAGSSAARAGFGTIDMAIYNLNSQNGEYLEQTYATPSATGVWYDEHRLAGLYSRASAYCNAMNGQMGFSCSADMYNEWTSGGSAGVNITQEGYCNIFNRSEEIRWQHFTLSVDGISAGDSDGAYKIRINGDDRWSDASSLGSGDQLAVAYPLRPGANSFRVEIMISGSAGGGGVLDFSHTFKFGIPLIDNATFTSDDGVFLTGAVTPEPTMLAPISAAGVWFVRRHRSRRNTTAGTEEATRHLQL